MTNLYSSSIISALARRTVHIKIQPTARTFSERREVLRVLENFGEVTMFRSLKYHPKAPVPNAFLSIFKDESAAQAAINASPMRYRLITDELPSKAHKSAIENTSDIPAGAQEGRDRSEILDKAFELSISASEFDHQHHIKHEPMFGSWTPIDRKHSFFGGGLEIPRSLMSAGLRDWETNGSKWRSVGDDEGARTPLEGLGVRNRGANGSGKDGVNPEWRVDQRRKKRLEGQSKDSAMGGLKRYIARVANKRSINNDDQQN